MSRLPDGWRNANLGEIAAQIQNGLYKPAEFYGSGHPFIRMYNLEKYSWLLRLEKLDLVTADESEFEKFRLDLGDILINRVNTVDLVGKTAWVDQSAAGFLFENMLIRVRVKNEVDSLFVAQQLNTDRSMAQIKRFAKKASGQASINSDDISQLPIILPPLAEQRKIAQILSTWDEAIALVEALIAALKRRKQGLMQRLLIHRHEVPDGWRRVRLREFLSKRNEWIILDDDSEYKRCTVKLHNIGVLPRDVVKGSELRTKRQQVTREGDLIVAEIDAKVGGFGIIKADTAGSIVSSHYYLYEIDPELSTDFLEQCIFAGLLQQQVDAIGSTNYAAIRPSDVLSYQIPFPTQEEREAITNLLVSCDQLAAVYQGYCTQLREQKRGLMQRLLTGEVRVQTTPVNSYEEG